MLYTLLRTLERRREVAKEQLPGGTTGYRLFPVGLAAAAPEPPEPPAGDSA